MGLLPAHPPNPKDVILIVYEYPFNERIRTLLRLEDLYEKFQFFVHQPDPMQHHVALSTIFDMLEVAGRAAQALLDKGEADAVAFGLWFIANPDLPIRLRQDAPLNALDADTLYAPAAAGYTDYPALA